MKIIVEGNQKNIETLIRENRVRVSRGVLSFAEVASDTTESDAEKAEVSVAPKAKVKPTPKAKVQK